MVRTESNVINIIEDASTVDFSKLEIIFPPHAQKSGPLHHTVWIDKIVYVSKKRLL